MKELLAGMAGADTQRVHVAVPVLLASGNLQAKAFLLSCLQGKGPAGFKPTLAFAQRLMLAGYREAFTLLDEALGRSEEIRFYGGAEDEAPVGERGLLCSIGGWHDERIFFDDNKPESAAKARSDLRTWLRSEWDAVKTGKPATMRVEGLSLPWGDLVGPGPGWVRQF